MDLSRYQFTFDPRKKGLRKILGDLEADVMEAIWALGRATVHDVLERLAAADRELAYTTVMTVMSRLADKGLLEKRKDGTAYVYVPAASKEEFTRRTVGTVLSELLDDFTAPAMSQFVDLVGEQDDAAIEALEKAIDERRRRADSDV
ncbi:MAG: Transcriptional regulator, MecI family [uncultured Gemmatimonadaceae bacterium]|uniref:Transcriptional regulator, MecI family n=1 Tax=uncultured Gemmatimonadaceae bacterium TaxID=246130 RepID=A0A6J4MLU7_9BACT|nr:MAG: Transcriptional regulator, MecI family [uncultured Gemmatimonadaceae bacterium]